MLTLCASKVDGLKFQQEAFQSHRAGLDDEWLVTDGDEIRKNRKDKLSSGSVSGTSHHHHFDLVNRRVGFIYNAKTIYSEEKKFGQLFQLPDAEDSVTQDSKIILTYCFGDL